MSFCLSLFFLSPFPAHWASCHFYCTGFSSCSASILWTVCELGFCCAWPPPHGGWAKIASARLHPGHSNRYVGGLCNFLSSVLLQQILDMEDQCYHLITAQFYSASKGKYTHEAWGWADPKGAAQSILTSFFYSVVFSPSWACPMQIGLAKKGACLFHLKFSMWSLDIFLVPFLWAFPFFVF